METLAELKAKREQLMQLKAQRDALISQRDQGQENPAEPIAPQGPQRFEDVVKNQMEPGLAQNLGIGSLSGIAKVGENLPNIFRPVEELGRNIAGKMLGRESTARPELNVYKTMGMEDKPWNTLAGAEQVAGELLIPGAGLRKSILERAAKIPAGNLIAKDIIGSSDFNTPISKAIHDMLGSVNNAKPGTLAQNIWENLPGSKLKQIDKNINHQIRYVENVGQEEIANVEQNANQQVRHVRKQAEEQEQNIHAGLENEAKQITGELGQGAPNISTNEVNIANDLRELHDPRAENASSFFEHVYNETNRERALAKESGQHNRGVIYEKVDPLTQMRTQEGADVTAGVKKHNFGEVGERFLEEPTVENAHKLGQEVGIRAEQLRSNPRKTPEERLELADLDNMYAKINKDIENYLEFRHPNQNIDLLTPWRTGKKIWEQEVLPFLYNKKLRNIVRPTKTKGGRLQAEKDIHSAFENIEHTNIVDKEGNIIPGPQQKLFNMLPEATRNKILWNKMGANPSADVTQLAQGLDAAKGRLGPFVPQTLEQRLSQALQEKQYAEKLPRLTDKHISELERNTKSTVKNLEESIADHINGLVDQAEAVGIPLRERQRMIKEGAMIAAGLAPGRKMGMLGRGIGRIIGKRI